jgi:hypothetical protein
MLCGYQLDHHLTISKALDAAKASLRLAMKQTSSSAQALDTAETRIVQLQRELRARDKPQDPQPAATAVQSKPGALQGLFGGRPGLPGTERAGKGALLPPPFGARGAMPPLQRGGATAAQPVVAAAQPRSSVGAEVLAELDISASVGDPLLQRETCGKCGKKFLPGYLVHHEPGCTVVVPDGVFDDDGDGTRAGNPTKGRPVHAHQVHCSICGKRLPPADVEAHEFGCRVRRTLQRRASLVEPSASVTQFAMPPPPPGSCSIAVITCNSMTVRWTNPVFDGGQPIYDVEMEYVLREKTVCTRLSRWCLELPIPSEQFVVSGLPASTAVRGIRVRCINVVGIGQWSPMISSVTTTGSRLHFFAAVSPTRGAGFLRLVVCVRVDVMVPGVLCCALCVWAAPTKPSAPLNFECRGVTPNSITLAWGEPFDTGGVAITGYTVHYATEVSSDAPARVAAGTCDCPRDACVVCAHTRFETLKRTS